MKNSMWEESDMAGMVVPLLAAMSEELRNKLMGEASEQPLCNYRMVMLDVSNENN